MEGSALSIYIASCRDPSTRH